MHTNRIHYMGEAGVQNTACNRYVPLSAHHLSGPVLWSPNRDDVTCKTCLQNTHPERNTQ